MSPKYITVSSSSMSVTGNTSLISLRSSKPIYIAMTNITLMTASNVHPITSRIIGFFLGMQNHSITSREAVFYEGCGQSSFKQISSTIPTSVKYFWKGTNDDSQLYMVTLLHLE